MVEDCSGHADLSGRVLGAAADLFLAKRFRKSVWGSCARPLSSCASLDKLNKGAGIGLAGTSNAALLHLWYICKCHQENDSGGTQAE